MKPLVLALALASLAACAGKKLEAPPCSGEVQGANVEGLAPVVWDDGRDTWLRFPGQQRIPAVTVLREDETEAAVNVNTDPDAGLVRVHGVHPGIVLRDRSRVACLMNQAYDRVGRRPPGGHS